MAHAGVVIATCIPQGLIHPRFEYLQRVLCEVFRQVSEDELVVVVDDHSASEVRDYLHALSGDIPNLVPVFREPITTGGSDVSEDGRPWRLASSRSFGVHQLTALDPAWDFCAFLDADCLPQENWLSTLRGQCPNGHVMQEVLFGRIDHQGPRGNEDMIFDLRLPLGAEEWTDSMAPRRSVSLFERGGGGNMAVTRGAWGHVGPFLADFDGGFGYEETEYACRAYERGADVFYSPGARVVHLFHPRGKVHYFRLERNRRIFMRRTGLSAFAREVDA